AATVLPSRVSGGKLVTTLTTFDGERFYSRTRWDPRDADGVPDQFCTPYASAITATIVREMVREKLLPYLFIVIGPGAALLWGEYLAGGVPATARESENNDEFLTAFRNASQSKAGLQTLLDNLVFRVAAAKPALSPPDNPTTMRLSDFPGVGDHYNINYNSPFDLPGNTAGGISLSSDTTGAV